MKRWIFVLLVSAAASACDDNLYLDPLPHDAGTDGAADGGKPDGQAPSDGGDAG